MRTRVPRGLTRAASRTPGAPSLLGGALPASQFFGRTYTQADNRHDAPQSSTPSPTGHHFLLAIWTQGGIRKCQGVSHQTFFSSSSPPARLIIAGSTLKCCHQASTKAFCDSARKGFDAPRRKRLVPTKYSAHKRFAFKGGERF